MKLKSGLGTFYAIQIENSTGPARGVFCVSQFSYGIPQTSYLITYPPPSPDPNAAPPPNAGEDAAPAPNTEEPNCDWLPNTGPLPNAGLPPNVALPLNAGLLPNVAALPNAGGEPNRPTDQTRHNNNNKCTQT